MKHTCQALMISCIDFRLVEVINSFAKTEGLADNYDHLKIAGSALSLARPTGESIRNFLLDQIAVSLNSHQARVVYIINHEDCGAYGGKAACESDQAEFNQHQIDLKSALEIIKNKFPEVEVKLYWLKLNKSFQKLV